MRTPQQDSRGGFTLVELLVVVAIIAILASMLMPALSRAREAGRRAVCASNLRQVGMSLQMYADESDGHFPNVQAMDCHGGTLMFRGNAMFPEYLTDLRVLLCPSHPTAREEYANGRWWDKSVTMQAGARPVVDPCEIDALSYDYVPWLIREEWLVDQATMDYDAQFSAGLTVALAYAALGTGPAPDWMFVDELGNAHRVLSARQGATRLLITDVNSPGAGQIADSEMSLMFDHVTIIPTQFNHIPGGANVLFMDGHVEYAKYPQPNPYPVSRAWAQTLSEHMGQDPLWYKHQGQNQ